MPTIKLFDIDGTLTLGYGDKPEETIFKTYSFWWLISHELAGEHAAVLEDAIKA